MRRFLLLASLLGLCGCASGPPPPLAPDLRATLGTIGVVSRGKSPDLDWSAPTTGVGSGAGVGLKMWWALSSQPQGCGNGVCALTLPFFALGGAIYGGVAGESPEAIANAEAALKEAMAGIHLQAALQESIFQKARDRTRYVVVLVQPSDLLGPGTESQYSALADQGVTTVLEVGVSQFALIGKYIGHNPPMMLAVNADAKLIRAKDGEVIYTLPVKYSSIHREFVEWAANNGQALRSEITSIPQFLANEILWRMFSSDLLPVPEPPPPAPTQETEGPCPDLMPPE